MSTIQGIGKTRKALWRKFEQELRRHKPKKRNGVKIPREKK